MQRHFNPSKTGSLGTVSERQLGVKMTSTLPQYQTSLFSYKTKNSQNRNGMFRNILIRHYVQANVWSTIAQDVGGPFSRYHVGMVAVGAELEPIKITVKNWMKSGRKGLIYPTLARVLRCFPWSQQSLRHHGHTTFCLHHPDPRVKLVSVSVGKYDFASSRRVREDGVQTLKLSTGGGTRLNTLAAHAVTKQMEPT